MVTNTVTYAGLILVLASTIRATPVTPTTMNTTTSLNTNMTVSDSNSNALKCYPEPSFWHRHPPHVPAVPTDDCLAALEYFPQRGTDPLTITADHDQYMTSGGCQLTISFNLQQQYQGDNSMTSDVTNAEEVRGGFNSLRETCRSRKGKDWVDQGELRVGTKGNVLLRMKQPFTAFANGFGQANGAEDAKIVEFSEDGDNWSSDATS